VPAIAETLPGYESQNWWGVLAPAGTPQPVLDRLYGAMTEVLQSKETGKRMESEGAETVRMTPPEFGRFISAELAKWVKVARDVGIQAE
jgi:tripartite-type tricarboxylate transporter receptor subunit TctC